MKKFTVLALAALLVVAFTVPASALENIFGGYWHTRFLTQRQFDGDNTGATDLKQVETRTRLYYTAKINDNLKLVNKFEMDTVWGDKNPHAYAGTVSTGLTGASPSTFTTNTTSSSGYSANWGDSGADGVAIEIKQSYADFNVGPVNFLVGIHNYTLGRGFISNDDCAGIHAIWKVNDGLYLPFAWQKIKEGGTGPGANEADIDAYVFAPIIYLSKDIKINPYYLYLHSRDARLFGLPVAGATSMAATGIFGINGVPEVDNLNGHILGVDFDGKFGPASVWFTGIYQFGSFEDNTGLLTSSKADTEIKLKGYCLAAGGKFDLGKADIHGQAFYLTGDDKNGLKDKELNQFFATSSQLYAWAEIMGAGVFDNSAVNVNTAQNNSKNAPGYFPTNILAANIGVTVKPMNKLAITADLWYAKLAEKNAQNKDYLGTEVDLKATYKLVEGLNLDLVAAYLFAGDATSDDGKNDRNPYELGMQLSLSF